MPGTPCPVMNNQLLMGNTQILVFPQVEIHTAAPTVAAEVGRKLRAHAA